MSERVLILGGTGFVGRAVVEAALARGAEVTVLNRGTRRAAEGVRALVADRRVPDALADALGSDLAVPGRRFDLVVDTWSWEPYVVRDSARLLESWADRYLYVSSRSVYSRPRAGSDESAALVPATPDDGDPRMPGTVPSDELDYARQKAGAERAVDSVFGSRAILVRPGLILGPWEDVGRLPWWLARMARGGEVLAPDRPETGIQLIDVRDLAWWLLGLPRVVPASPKGAPGTVGSAFAVDAVSPVGLHTMGELLEACVAVAGNEARLRWVPEAVLLAAGVQPWTELPVWLPAGADRDALHAADGSKGRATGLASRPLAATVADTWAWLGEQGGVAPRRADRPQPGLDPDVEERILRGRQ